MKISYHWLKDYVNIDQLSPQKLAEILTETGLEVAGIEKVESIKGGLEGFVIGQVITCAPHPDSDHLSKTTVDVGGRILAIVCGAPNVAAGQKVVVAPVGTTLHMEEGPFPIKKVKIRGEVSEGMICAEDEMGIGTDHEGIVVLDPAARVGMPARDYFHVEEDWSIEIDLTPNRIDGASHIGVARDVAAWLNLKKNTRHKKPSVDAFKADTHALEIPVEVQNTEACPRYSGVTLSGITVKESPQWLQNRLRTIGLTPINNIVDVTNYVLFETGQPLHAFDAGKITGNKVVVRTMEEGTIFTTLDEEERKLHADDLMICNAESGMCIAGVFGGAHSGVTGKTKNIFLESACFHPLYIRKTARRHDLNTDAAYRFERGTDPNGTIYALKRAALLIRELAGGTISSEIVDVYPHPVADFEVSLEYKNITRLIGKEIGSGMIRKILASLEIQIVSENESGLVVHVPTYRVDVQREADVIEEILRIYGYNNVEIPSLVKSTVQTSPKPDPEKIKNRISEMLTAQGFYEIMANSLTRADYYKNMTGYPDHKTVRLFNPLSSDLNGMRQTLLFGGLESIAYNINRQHPDLRFYEFGNCYFKKDACPEDSPADRYYEEEHLGLFVTGRKEPEQWNAPAEESSFFQIKAYAENILRKTGCNLETLRVEESACELLSDGLVYLTGNHQKLAEAGFVAPEWLKKFDIGQPVYYADFNWGLLLRELRKNKVEYHELPKYPAVRRDLALLIDKGVKFDTLKKLAFHTERKILREVNLFDVYEGEGIPEGKKSYALSYILRDDKCTLKEKQIDKVMKKLVSMYERELGAQLR